MQKDITDMSLFFKNAKKNLSVIIDRYIDDTLSVRNN